MNKLVRVIFVVVCTYLDYGVTNNVTMESPVYTKRTSRSKTTDPTLQENIVASNLTAYNLYLPVIKQFVVDIGHPIGFNITFYAEAERWIVVEFHGNINERSETDEGYQINGLFYKKKVNQTHVSHYFQDKKTQLKAGDTVYFVVYVSDPECNTRIIRNGRFNVK